MMQMPLCRAKLSLLQLAKFQKNFVEVELLRQFEDKTYLITGASSGIGRATAVNLASAGSNIVGMARDRVRLDATISALPGDGHEGIAGDAADEQIVAAMVKIGRARGGFDGAVLAAGTHAMMPLMMAGNASFDEMYRTNVLTAVNGLKIMNKGANKAGAAVVLLSSVAAERGSVGFVAYAAAKAALIGIAKTAAIEMAPRKIRVNTIIAGVVDTPLSEKWMGQLSDAQRAEVEASHLLGIGKPENIVDAITFLISDGARWVTGAELLVDGGLSVR